MTRRGIGLLLEQNMKKLKTGMQVLYDQNKDESDCKRSSPLVVSPCKLGWVRGNPLPLDCVCTRSRDSTTQVRAAFFT
jgi:hypothetical protein